MSQHHRASKHTTYSPRVRRLLAATLPRKCMDCPHVVTEEMRWQVGHLIPANQGGRTTFENCAPSHEWCPWCRKRCNQSSGGRMGAAKVNAARRRAQPRPSPASDLWKW